MTQVLFGKKDEAVEQIADALSKYEADHPKAVASVYRKGVVSVRIRIVDPDFAEMGRAERSDLAWPYLRLLPEEVHADITMLLLLAPEELSRSPANVEFENPLPNDWDE